MSKRPLASAVGWMGVFGVLVMLATSACESTTVQPAPTQTKPIVKTSAGDDPPEKPIKPPGGN